MLIEFKVTNFRSIKDTQTLSMVAGSGNELPQNLSSFNDSSEMKLLRSAAIYGPNAAGKSNLIRALDFMKDFVLDSARESREGDPIYTRSFIFDEKTSKEPSKFEIIFCKDNIRYQYGFSADKRRVIEEWVLAYPQGKPQEWFERKYDTEKKEYVWHFSRNFKGQKKLLEDSTRNNALFLSTAIQLNNEQLKPIFEWFKTDLKIVFSLEKLNYENIIEKINDQKYKEILLKYLKIADPSITYLAIFGDGKNMDNDPYFKNHQNKPNNFLRARYDDSKSEFVILKRIEFFHDNSTIGIHFSDESGGFQSIFKICDFFISAFSEGGVVVIDELDNGFHTHTTEFLINLINNKDINQKNPQLIFSTHDTSLLNTDIFRRDQIWFVEKDKDNSSNLYSLLEFKPRKEEPIGKRYLQGRYGAIPFVGEWSF